MSQQSDKIDLIYSINSTVERYQGRVLSPEDFNILYDLSVQELRDVRDSILKSVRENLLIKH